MGKDNLVSETPDALLINAERDLMNLKVLLSKKFYPEDFMYNPMCFHATQAVEKLLKSYIISNGRSVEKTHDLDYLCETATGIDASFEKITGDHELLNSFTPSRKYDDEITITRQDMNDIIKSLNNICNFPPIKAMRDTFNKTHKYEIIDEANTCLIPDS